MLLMLRKKIDQKGVFSMFKKFVIVTCLLFAMTLTTDYNYVDLFDDDKVHAEHSDSEPECC